jgi:hypothetical protein
MSPMNPKRSSGLMSPGVSIGGAVASMSTSQGYATSPPGGMLLGGGYYLGWVGLGRARRPSGYQQGVGSFWIEMVGLEREVLEYMRYSTLFDRL